jgi:hypothetical protein
MPGFAMGVILFLKFFLSVDRLQDSIITDMITYFLVHDRLRLFSVTLLLTS